MNPSLPGMPSSFKTFRCWSPSMSCSAAGPRRRPRISPTMVPSIRSTAGRLNSRNHMATTASVALKGRKTRGVLPGFGLTLGYTMVYLSLLVLIPLSAVFIRSVGSGFGHFWNVVTAPRVLASLRLSFGASAIAALINATFGLIVAWVLVRHDFPFKRLVDAIGNLPFALPTAVAGIALTA